jgi:hypothetical protein
MSVEGEKGNLERESGREENEPGERRWVAFSWERERERERFDDGNGVVSLA